MNMFGYSHSGLRNYRKMICMPFIKHCCFKVINRHPHTST